MTDKILLPQKPLYHKETDAYFYPLTSEDQVIVGDRRLNQLPMVIAEFNEVQPGEASTIDADSLDGVLAENYATKIYVSNEIAKAQLSGEGGDIDLSGYATKEDLYQIKQLPSHNENDEGKFLRIVGNKPSWIIVPDVEEGSF